MSRTTNLDLVTEQSDSTKFSDYVNNVDGNFVKIDQFAGTKGAANGLASLDAQGKVPSSQLPEISAGIDIRRLSS